MLNSFLIIIVAAGLDIVANLLIKRSDGFKKKHFGVPALILVCVAFTLLARVTPVIGLAVAYITWGAFAILGTVIAARILFRQRLNSVGWLGILMIFTSIVLLNVQS